MGCFKVTGGPVELTGLVHVIKPLARAELGGIADPKKRSMAVALQMGCAECRWALSVRLKRSGGY